MSKVTVAIITKDQPYTRCLDSVKNQTFKDITTVISSLPPTHTHQNKILEKYLNCTANRNNVKEMALKTDCDWILYLDDDIVLPSNAIESFLKWHRVVQGGYYRKRGNPKEFVCGRLIVVGNPLVANYTMPGGLIPQEVNGFISYTKPTTTFCDFVGPGCMFMRRDIAEKITFKAGTGTLKDVYGNICLMGEAGELAFDLDEIGIIPGMNGSVICGHIGIDTPAV